MGEMRAEDQSKRRARMERVDAMPPDIRECVHEYGLSIVQAMLDAGVKKGRHMHHIVRLVRSGSYQSAADPLHRIGYRLPAPPEASDAG